MINYIMAELYRAKKSKIIKILMIAGIIIPVIFARNFVENYGSFFENMDFLENTSFYIPDSAIVISIIVVIFVEKNKDEYQLLLSGGLDRFHVVLNDFFTYEILMILISILFFINILILELFVSKICGYDTLKSFYMFFNAYIEYILLAIPMAMLVFIFVNIFKPGLGIAFYFFSSILYAATEYTTSKIVRVIRNAFTIFLPSYLENVGKFVIGFNLKYMVYLIFYGIFAIFISYICFKRRDL